MYVTGRNGSGTGTILSSLCQMHKDGLVNSVTVMSPSKSSAKHVSDAMTRINELLKSTLKVNFVEGNSSSIAKVVLENKTDACIISVPDHLHFECAKATLQAGLHTLIVKPLVPTVSEANQLIDLSNEKKLFGCVEFHKRYDETNLWIRRALSENKIGKINYFQVDYSQRIDIPMKTFGSWSNRTNIFQYLGVHYVDLFYFLTSAKPLSISANGVDGVLKDNGIDTFDSVHCTIKWKDKNRKEFFSIHNTNWIDPNCSSALSDQKYKVVGTHGRIECDQKNRGLELVTDSTGIQQINPYFSDFLPDASGELKFSGYGHTSISQFIKDVQSLSSKEASLEMLNKTRPSFNESLLSTAVIEAANKSLSSNGAWTEIKF